MLSFFRRKRHNAHVVFQHEQGIRNLGAHCFHLAQQGQDSFCYLGRGCHCASLLCFILWKFSDSMVFNVFASEGFSKKQSNCSRLSVGTQGIEPGKYFTTRKRIITNRVQALRSQRCSDCCCWKKVNSSIITGLRKTMQFENAQNPIFARLSEMTASPMELGIN